MARTAARALAAERVTTAPMRQPRSRKTLAQASPYAPRADDGNRSFHSSVIA